MEDCNGYSREQIFFSPQYFWNIQIAHVTLWIKSTTPVLLDNTSHSLALIHMVGGPMDPGSI